MFKGILKRAVATAVGAATAIPVIVGVGAMRTDEAQSLARDAAAEGAAGLLLAPVSYSPLTEEEIFEHFLAVASASDLPLCIYSNPSTTNFTFRPELVARLKELEVRRFLLQRHLCQHITDALLHSGVLLYR